MKVTVNITGSDNRTFDVERDTVSTLKTFKLTSDSIDEAKLWLSDFAGQLQTLLNEITDELHTHDIEVDPVTAMMLAAGDEQNVVTPPELFPPNLHSSIEHATAGNPNAPELDNPNTTDSNDGSGQFDF